MLELSTTFMVGVRFDLERNLPHPRTPALEMKQNKTKQNKNILKIEEEMNNKATGNSVKVCWRFGIPLTALLSPLTSG